MLFNTKKLLKNISSDSDWNKRVEQIFIYLGNKNIHT